MRVHFEAPAHLAEVATLDKLFTSVREQYGMDATFHDLSRRPRLLLMVSQHGHCLNDLLYRWHSQQLNVDIAAVVNWLRTWESDVTSHAVSCHLWSIVESAGALFSPLGPSATNFELASALEPAFWVLVAPDALGVLHDVRVTWEACARRGLVPDFLVLSGARTADASTGTNADELRTLGIADPLQTLQHGSEDLSPLARALLAKP
jgi:hypothetical protein